MFTAGFTFFTTFGGVCLARKFGFSQAKTGDFFAIVGIFIAISQALLVGLFAKKFADFQVLRWSFFGLAVMVSVYVFADSSALLYWTIPLFTMFNGLSMANLSSLISRSAAMGRQGEAMGIYSSVQNLTQVPASALVGYITGSAAGSVTPMVVSTAIIAFAGVAFIALFRPTPDLQAAQPGSPAH